MPVKEGLRFFPHGDAQDMPHTRFDITAEILRGVHVLGGMGYLIRGPSCFVDRAAPVERAKIQVQGAGRDQCDNVRRIVFGTDARNKVGKTV